MPPSPWANQSIAPLQAAGALVPFVETDRGAAPTKHLHGTAFFISDAGFFLTAAHVIEDYANIAPPLAVVIVNANGVSLMPVAAVARHPTLDVALGIALVDPQQSAMPSPMTLSSRRLRDEENVAILGYPHTLTEHSADDTEEATFRFTFTPDYFEGKVVEHRPDGIGLVKGAAYLTDIVPPSHLKDFGGISGGPLVESDSVHVHGILCSSSESYAICADITSVLEWDAFEHNGNESLTVREFGGRYPGLIRVV